MASSEETEPENTHEARTKIPPRIHRALKQEARRQGCTKAAIIRRALMERYGMA